MAFSEYTNFKSDANQSSYFRFIGDKICWSDKEQPVVHGNLDGREMKQAVTQRTSQLPLLLVVAGNSRYRTKNLKRFIQGLVFKGILKGQESKSWDFFEGPRRFRGPQKSEKFYFSKRTKTSVDHKFKSFAINWPQISI